MYVFLYDEHNKNIRILAHVSAIFCEISRRRALLTQVMSLCKKEQLVADLGWMGLIWSGKRNWEDLSLIKTSLGDQRVEKFLSRRGWDFGGNEAAARQRENVSLLAACFNWVRGSYHLCTHGSFKYLVPGSMPEKKTKGSFQEILSY